MNLLLWIMAVFLPLAGMAVEKKNMFPAWAPVSSPVMTGEVEVGVIFIQFADTEFREKIPEFMENLSAVEGLSLDEYFKLYSHGIVWPRLIACPGTEKGDVYQDRHLLGYYCQYDATRNPLGFLNEAEGRKRVSSLKKAALAWARSRNGKLASCKVRCAAYATDIIGEPERRPSLLKYYKKMLGTSLLDEKEAEERAWEYYRPVIKWSDPLWPNSSVQITSSSSRTMAHELGHVFGAPDVYRVSRENDGIAGAATLMAYGPTSSSFSLYYHHGFVQERNCPTITRSGTYVLHPRHVRPEGDMAVGYFIPSGHPHYYYYLEYICGEHPALGVVIQENEGMRTSGSGSVTGSGMLISVFHPGMKSYLGSPDTCYTYRPGDQYFRGRGEIRKCLFGPDYGRTEFTLETNPSSRLPNLLDGGVRIRNIRKEEGKAVFDVELTGKSISGMEYRKSLLPQIGLTGVEQVLPSSFVMTCVPKFRGEPVAERYGFCWGTAPHPTIKNSRLVLMHREIYKGRALGVSPGTRYFIRAFAENAHGIRYSDEELEVVTPLDEKPQDHVAPLMLDSYSDNAFAVTTVGGSAHYSSKIIPASAIVLAKWWVYYKPGNLKICSETGEGLIGKPGGKKGKMNFDQVHYDPWKSDPVYRTSLTGALFREARFYTLELKMDEQPLNVRKWMKGFVRLMKCRGKPVLTELTSESLGGMIETVKKELKASRPVMVIGTPPEYAGEHNQWGLITGYDGDGKFLLDFPVGNNPSFREKKKGEMGDLLQKNGFKIYLVTGIEMK